MKHAQKTALVLLIMALLVMGCSDSTESPSKPATNGEPAGHAPHGNGPNGGVVFDLGAHHAEFTVDHPAKTCTVLVIDGDNEKAKPLPIAATGFTLTTKETKTEDGTVVAPMTIKLMPKEEQDGKASKFVGTDPGIGNVADFEGTVIGAIDGKPAKGTFKEE